ncbi:trypco2 family protein [Actinomadura nitritigenes]|uniref:trypco2 family protein n=1 Tax=Actinomadura nitritigenes TaxID=134602 RepID=UPI0036CF89F9
MADKDWLDLADVVRALRRELAEAAAEGAAADVHFEVGPVEMEFLVDVKREGGADAGVRFGVVSFGGKGSVISGSAHRLKLVLTPKDGEGRPPQVSGRGSRIAER